MGCLRRFLIVASVLWNLATFAVILIVLGGARTLGDTVFFAESDALLIFIASAVGLGLTLLLAPLLYLGHRRARRLERQLRSRPEAALTRSTGAGPSQSTSWE